MPLPPPAFPAIPPVPLPALSAAVHPVPLDSADDGVLPSPLVPPDLLQFLGTSLPGPCPFSQKRGLVAVVRCPKGAMYTRAGLVFFFSVLQCPFAEEMESALKRFDDV